ncbi:carbon-nitrogen hydrolase [Paraburkholderia bryophila]|uniref:nitrilase-related carbon-nitrogen hydrolase n=1 Tax=Paraburkholderia bryophila TaxID=420952 RepID=UPI0023494325|nr:nitrilase-related carbon-nitrogen hydrolase [Paraburkholderia bryophila]WCM23861.1 carbon-nitrogen hydrolase [Paraburkholderia bryophila]
MSSSSSPLLRVASIPLVSRRGDAAWNVARVAACLADAAGQNIGLAVFPESCLTGYASMAKLSRVELDGLAESIEGPSIRAVTEAVERTGVAAGVGFVERAADGRLFNSYVVCLPGGQRHGHRKLHAFEHRRMSNGDRFTVFDTSWGMRVGILIGADNYLVENVRMTALMGATLLIAPHRSFGARSAGALQMQPVSFEQARRGKSTRHAPNDRTLGDPYRWLPARAADNGLFIAFSDGAHVADDTAALGTGMIVDPDGRMLALNTETTNTLFSADIEADRTTTSAGSQWLGARRPDLYGPLSRPDNRLTTNLEPASRSPRGSIAVSFAQVGRNRLTG